MKAVFLSDAHLTGDRDEGYRKLLRFFDEIRNETSHIVIAGDLFDFWFCDDRNLYPGFKEMFEALIKLRQGGITLSLLEGNHDFFLDRAFNGHDIAVFKNHALFDFDGLKVYVSHGDTVDGSNRYYLLLRRFLRSGLFYSVQKRIPSRLLWEMARLSSHSSRRYQKHPERIVSVMRSFAREKIGAGIDAVVLGHSHQPILEQVGAGTRTGTLALLGDWVEHFSYISLEDGRFSLEFFRTATQ
ncbi:MAG: UDP-2,3-diacylglucosamine diphosphatase [Syntrophales bacterium]|jgi:UDP-2,3-diacylglucosamine hydrolase|nr:UDP-2,3-diacylglucosamine diphosphatase [Syntrophales bacterium]MCK9528289.1 UDP-2,3-diacylglucosamine diphosphatase [Syntrophales bacterium]MDX9922421.1 UDP-2,3-diacylglucosamine diphosphatase [Syntrophales bacterium]